MTKRHELTAGWSEVTGLTNGTRYRCSLVGAWRPAFIWTDEDAPAVSEPGTVLRPRDSLTVKAMEGRVVFARCEATGAALLLNDQVAS